MDIARGEQLFGRYDHKNERLSNKQFLTQYGFYDPLNEEPITVWLDPPLYEDDPLLSYKLWVLGKEGDKTTGYSVFPKADFDSDATKDALSILRVTTFDDVDFFFAHEVEVFR